MYNVHCLYSHLIHATVVIHYRSSTLYNHNSHLFKINTSSCSRYLLFDDEGGKKEAAENDGGVDSSQGVDTDTLTLIQRGLEGCHVLEGSEEEHESQTDTHHILPHPDIVLPAPCLGGNLQGRENRDE